MAMAVPEELRPLKRTEYHQLGELGAFEGERVELIDGFIVRMPPIDPPHSGAVIVLNQQLVLKLAGRAIVSPQNPFAASEISEPEPDLSVLPLADYRKVHPEQAHLIIEVSNTSLSLDRGRKARLYAESHVPEYWVVNIGGHCVEVHTEPLDGKYQRISRYERDASIRLVAFPDVELSVCDFLL